MTDYLDKIICGDCLDVMRGLPDKSVDLVLTDPPYGIGEAKGKNKTRGNLAQAKDYGVDDWDDNIPERGVFDEIRRVSKHAIIFGGNYFAEYLDNSPCWIVWDKLNGDSDFADCELAWTNFSSAVRKFTFKWQGMLQGDMKEKEIRYHPTQKPVKLFRQILNSYSNPGDTILDPFLGSGTTAVACVETGRHYIGIELEEKYCEIARRRVAEATPSLFAREVAA